jgi:hypothetical protein
MKFKVTREWFVDAQSTQEAIEKTKHWYHDIVTAIRIDGSDDEKYIDLTNNKTEEIKKEPDTIDLISKNKRIVVEEALARKLVTREELKKYLGQFSDEFGYDSFVQYLAQLNALDNKGGPKPNDRFLTMNKNMLIQRKELEKRFKLNIREPGDVWDDMMDGLAKSI